MLARSTPWDQWWDERYSADQCESRTGVRGVLEADPRQIDDGGFRVGRSSRLAARSNRAELGVYVVAGQQPGIECVFQLAEGRTLREAIHDHEIGAVETTGIQFLLSWRIRSESRDVHTRLEPLGRDERLSGRRRGDQQVGRAADLLHVSCGRYGEPLRGHVAAVALDVRRRGAPRHDAREPTYGREAADLHTCLDAGPDDAHGPERSAREEIRRERAGSSRADVGQEAVVE